MNPLSGCQSGHYLSFHNKGKGSFGDVIALAKIKPGLWQYRERSWYKSNRKIARWSAKRCEISHLPVIESFFKMKRLLRRIHALSRIGACLSLVLIQFLKLTHDGGWTYDHSPTSFSIDRKRKWSHQLMEVLWPPLFIKTKDNLPVMRSVDNLTYATEFKFYGVLHGLSVQLRLLELHLLTGPRFCGPMVFIKRKHQMLSCSCQLEGIFGFLKPLFHVQILLWNVDVS